MISFDYLTLNAFFEENKDFFCGARLQKIQQPTRRDFVFTIRGKSETRKLYININPLFYHICFLNDETYNKRNIVIPKKPPMFCMLLRKYLEGFRISGVNVPNYERMFEIYFESYNELNEKIELCLSVELMGKYSNVILYDCNTKIIIGCAHNVGFEKSRNRELAGTLPYCYPPAQGKSDILRYNGTLNYDDLNTNFMGISKAFQQQLKNRKVPLEKIKDYVELKSKVLPAINDKEFSIYSELLENPRILPSVSDMIDSYYSTVQEKFLIQSLRQRLLNVVLPKCKKQKLSVTKIIQQIQKKDNAKKYKKYGDLIVANLYNLKDYSSEAELYDWEEDKYIIVPLDKKLSLKENSQKYYNMFTKSKSASEKLLELKKQSENLLSYLEQILYAINTSHNLKSLQEVQLECESLGYIPKSDVVIKDNDVNIDFVEINGYKVYIGRNNRQNDLIISKLSSPDDIWFHIQNNTGSHILLKNPDKTDPDEKTIYECCVLAKKYSSASGDTKAGVIYTKRKFLKKPPKANLGYVTYRNEKEIIVS